jgi:hypothetical protein
MSGTSKADVLRAIKGSPQYIQEKYLHDRSCDHAVEGGVPVGRITQIVTTPYGLDSREVDCMFCRRKREAIEARKAV